MNERFMPAVLDAQAQSMHLGIEHGIQGGTGAPLVDCRFRAQVRGSLRQFLRFMNEDDLVDSRVRGFVKSGQEVLDGKFTLSDEVVQSKNTGGYRKLSPGGNATFYIDGDQGFGLGLKRVGDAPLWVGVLSFSAGENLNRYYDNGLSVYRNDAKEHMHPRSEEIESYNRARKIAEVGLEKFGSEGKPIVVQIQGVTSAFEAEDGELLGGTYKNACDFLAARNLLKKIKWEQALLSFFSDWVRSSGQVGFYILPAENIIWGAKDSEERMERLKARYNWTARRFGLKRDERGLWG